MKVYDANEIEDLLPDKQEFNFEEQYNNVRQYIQFKPSKLIKYNGLEEVKEPPKGNTQNIQKQSL